MSEVRADIYRRLGKRVLDFVLALVAIVALSPILLVLALLVRVFLGSPVFFRQPRPGYKGVPFQMIKFRTMTDARDASGALLPDAMRSTALGRFLRRTSLDELPELWNILVGNMSLVGPRPLLMEYLPYYSDREARRHDVLPGLTGLAQISGRNFVRWDQRLELDARYADELSFALDLRILLVTIWQAVRGKDVLTVPGQVQPHLHIERAARGMGSASIE